MLFRSIGKLDATESPTADEYADCLLVLNMMCKQWMGKADFAPGLKVWTRKRGHLLLSNQTGQYTIGPTAQGWTNSLVSTTLSATAVAGDSTLYLTSVTGISVNDTVAVELDAGYLFYTTVSAVDTVNLTITIPTLPTQLPSQASSGNMVYAYTTAAQNIVTMETAILRDDMNSDTPLRLLTVQNYDYLPNKAEIGRAHV